MQVCPQSRRFFVSTVYCRRKRHGAPSIRSFCEKNDFDECSMLQSLFPSAADPCRLMRLEIESSCARMNGCVVQLCDGCLTSGPTPHCLHLVVSKLMCASYVAAIDMDVLFVPSCVNPWVWAVVPSDVNPLDAFPPPSSSISVLRYQTFASYRFIFRSQSVLFLSFHRFVLVRRDLMTLNQQDTRVIGRVALSTVCC